MAFLKLVFVTCFVCFFAAFKVHAEAVLCTKVYPIKKADTSLERFIEEMNGFNAQVSRFQDLLEKSNQIEAWKASRGVEVRQTRQRREMKIHRWRMAVRTGDVYRVVESMRNLFDNVFGQARLLDEARRLHLVLKDPLIESHFQPHEHSKSVQSLESIMDQAIATLGRDYADYAAANMVLRELKDSGELENSLEARGQTLEQFESSLRQTEQVDGRALRAYRSHQAFQSIYQMVSRRLPPNQIQILLMPDIFKPVEGGHFDYVREIFNGGNSRYDGSEIYRPDGPLRRTLEVDLKAERMATLTHLFVITYGKFLDQYVTLMNFVPGGGFRLNTEALADSIFGKTAFAEKLVQGVSSLSSHGRWFLYLFARAFINRRAVSEHLPDVETLHKILHHKGDAIFFSAVRDMAAKHGELNFYMTFSRMPFYHETFLTYKAMLKEKIEEAKKLGVRSHSLEQSWAHLEAGEIRGAQLGTLNILVKISYIEEAFASTALFFGSKVAVYEVANMLISADPASSSIIYPIFGL